MGTWNVPGLSMVEPSSLLEGPNPLCRERAGSGPRPHLLTAVAMGHAQITKVLGAQGVPY